MSSSLSLDESFRVREMLVGRTEVEQNKTADEAVYT